MNPHAPFLAVIALVVPLVGQVEPDTLIPGLGAVAGGAYLFIRTLRQDNSYDKLVKGLRQELEDQRRDHKEDRERWEQVVANKDAQITRLNQQLREQSERLNLAVQEKSMAEARAEVLRLRYEANVPWDGGERRTKERRDHQDVPPPPALNDQSAPED